jgi:transposase-like protein
MNDVLATAPTAEEKLRTVLAVLSNRATCAQEALRRGVKEADVERWRRLFIDSGCLGLLKSGRLKPQPATTGLDVQNTALKSALYKKLAELRCQQQMAHGLLGPFARVEEIRRESEINISRFCVLIGVSRRTYFRRLVLLKSTRAPGDAHDFTSITSTCARLVEDYLVEHPSYGYRRIHELMIADGHMVSASTVLRAIRVSQRQERGEPQAGGLPQGHFAYCSCHGREVGGGQPGIAGPTCPTAAMEGAFEDTRVGAAPAHGAQVPGAGDARC